MHLIAEGRRQMIAQGNLTQWADGHPSEQQVAADIRRGCSYLLMEGGIAVATFALIPGPDPTYSVIYDGQWINDRPYYVIHRVSSLPNVHGVMAEVFDYAFSLTDTVRIDTHRANLSMLAALRRHHFTYCGIIHLADGAERLAFMKTTGSSLSQTKKATQ